jgi:pilus assembly protein FimV
MFHVRKLVLAIAAASALSSGMANALELGELTLKSAVNQPLLAEIELLDIRGTTAAEIKPALATPEDFARFGVDRQAFLNDLTFTPVVSASGRSVIRVTSSQPLSVPLIKFLVQVNWPSGRLLRDYSALLDPSKFSPQAAEDALGSATPALIAPNVPTRGSSYTTGRRDTLWEIAARNSKGASVQQTMLAIQALNPDAFLDGNINRLKTGQVLRLPDAQQSTALPQGQAVAEVARQNAAWRDGRRLGPGAQQLDATRRPGPGNAPAPEQPRDNLSLVSGASRASNGAGGDAKALADQLEVTQESLDATRRDNEELKSRMTDLQSQLDKLQKLIQLKNDQLAKLQAAGADVPVPAEGVADETPANPPDGATPPISAELAPAAPGTLPAPADQPADDSAASTSAAPPPAPVQPGPIADEDDSATHKLLASPLLLGLVGGGALLVLLLLLLLLARRRKAQQEAEKHMRMARALAEESDYNEDFDLPESSFEGLERPAPNVQLTPAMVAASVAAAAASARPATFAPPPPQTVIPTPALKPSADTDESLLAEVEQSIAKGRLNHAAELLEAATEREPARSDLRLKLMEVYGLQGDRDGFISQERQLVANGKNHADVEQLKSRFPAMLGVAAVAASAAAVAAEMDAEYVKQLLEDEPGAADSIDGTFDSDFDLSLDEPDESTADELSAADFNDDLSLDTLGVQGAAGNVEDDLDFDALLKQHSAGAEPVDDLDDFNLDVAADEPARADAEADPLDIDAQLAEFDESLDLATPATPAAPEDFELPEDFDLSLADEPEPAAEAKAQAMAADVAEANAELDALSASISQPPLTEGLTARQEEELADFGDDADFDFLDGGDEATTKLDLARAYIEMGDSEGARDILGEVLKEGNAGQQDEAKDMLSKLA